VQAATTRVVVVATFQGPKEATEHRLIGALGRQRHRLPFWAPREMAAMAML